MKCVSLFEMKQTTIKTRLFRKINYSGESSDNTPSSLFLDKNGEIEEWLKDSSLLCVFRRIHNPFSICFEITSLALLIYQMKEF